MTATLPLLQSLAARIEPRHTAVLVIDMQNDFCAPDGWTATVIKKDVSRCAAAAVAIGILTRQAREARVPVVWLRADYSADKLPASMRARAASMAARDCCVPGTGGADWFEVAPKAGELVLTKHCYSGFIGTSLDAELRARGVRTLVFTGVQTHVCVESTLRDAHSLGYYCVIAEECVASHTPAAHAQTLANVRFLFGDVAPLDEIVEEWRSR